MKPIGEMTLNEVRELKKGLCEKIESCVMEALDAFEAEYGIAVDVRDVWTERDSVKDICGKEITYRYGVKASVVLKGETI